MKVKPLLLITLFSLFACSNLKNNTISEPHLPNNHTINQVIAAIIEQDSLSYDNELLKEFKNIKFYTPYFVDSLWIPPPPDGFYYDQVLVKFDPQNKEIRLSDSIFLSKQSNTFKRYTIADSICNKFLSESSHVYQFYVPIFSSDMKTVFLQYWDDCGVGCGKQYTCVLRWKEDKWVLTDKWLSMIE